MEYRASKFIKNKNRQLILETIIKNDKISRSDLSKLTKLNKVTTSSQVQSLLDEKLITETKVDKSTGGRKPIHLSINSTSAYFLGVDIDSNYINFLLTDLSGKVIQNYLIDISISNYQSIVQIIKNEALKFENLTDIKTSIFGLSAMVIGVHGIVNKTEEIIFTPQHGWSNVSLTNELSKHFSFPIYTENNANLCAYAEYVFHKETDNLISISTYSGIGLGMVNNNEIFKGFHGFAGEVGHMIIETEGLQCNCGNQGCWELYASEKVLIDNLKLIKNLDKLSWHDVELLFEQGDDETISILEDHVKYLSIGLNNILNIYNPESIVINTGLKNVFIHFDRELQKRLTSKMNYFKGISISKVGKNACMIGACALGIRSFLEINDLYLDLKMFDKMEEPLNEEYII